ncbi:hypothetical protein ACFSQT_36135 [Mesorhizobium calcicola]|uniref:Transposase n=1 Tax=Mesorhizobium calcicola TaxID=1300310 RepID=A0ABW4WS52_9HYPH
MTQRRVDKERIERADRESKLMIEAERLARDTKTARLREQRLFVEASAEKPAPVKRQRGAARSRVGKSSRSSDPLPWLVRLQLELDHDLHKVAAGLVTNFERQLSVGVTASKLFSSVPSVSG